MANLNPITTTVHWAGNFNIACQSGYAQPRLVFTTNDCRFAPLLLPALLKKMLDMNNGEVCWVGIGERSVVKASLKNGAFTIVYGEPEDVLCHNDGEVDDNMAASITVPSDELRPIIKDALVEYFNHPNFILHESFIKRGYPKFITTIQGDDETEIKVPFDDLVEMRNLYLH